MKKEKKLFNLLLDLKNENKLFDFDNITREQLKQLWFDEMVFDREIASLFNVSEYRVKKKRRELNLLFKQCVFDTVIEKYKNDYGLTVHDIDQLRNMVLMGGDIK